MAHPGAVSFNFDRKGVLRVPKKYALEDELFLAVTEAGAEDFLAEDEEYIIITEPALLDTVKEVIVHLGAEHIEADIEMIPKSFIECSEEDEKSNLALIEWLEGIDDVDAVFHNIKQ